MQNHKIKKTAILIYLGKVKHKNELYDGQHPAIIDQETFDKVAEIRAYKDVAKRSCLYKKNEVGILPCAIPTKPANICKGGDKQICPIPNTKFAVISRIKDSMILTR